MFLFDSIGLGVFTIIGIEKGIEFGLHPIICIALGTITASFGGVIRDILCNEIPVIFRKEIYATACLVGGCFYLLLLWLGCNDFISVLVPSMIIFIVRTLSVVKNWSLPKF